MGVPAVTGKPKGFYFTTMKIFKFSNPKLGTSISVYRDSSDVEVWIDISDNKSGQIIASFTFESRDEEIEFSHILQSIFVRVLPPTAKPLSHEQR